MSLDIERSAELSQFHPFTLQFTGENKTLEADFKEKYFTTYKGPIRIAIGALLIFYILFSFLDYRIDPGNYWNFFFIRIIIVAPISILFIIATFQKWFKNASQLITSLMMILGGSGIIYMIHFGNNLVINHYSSGLFLVLLSLFAFLHIRFIWAVLTAAIILCEYIVCIYLPFHSLQHNID